MIDIPLEKTICTNTSYSIALTEGYDSYQWFQEGNLIEENRPLHTFSEKGNYSVAVTNFCGNANATMKLDFWNISIPNIITPNNDGKNDLLIIKGIDKGEWDLTVYNRWGKQIYRNTAFKNNWISTDADGTYYYSLTHKDKCNFFKGWIYLVK